MSASKAGGLPLLDPEFNPNSTVNCSGGRMAEVWMCMQGFLIVTRTQALLVSSMNTSRVASLLTELFGGRLALCSEVPDFLQLLVA
jgi:hypothetical protein